MVNHLYGKPYMGAIKTTINLDEDVLREFRKAASSRYGGYRNLSRAIEEAMRNYNTTALLVEYAKAEDIDLNEMPSSREIVSRRPVVDWSAGEELKEMRENRAVHLSRQ